MCKACFERRENAIAQKKLNERRQQAKDFIYILLVTDRIKGSEWETLTNMINGREEDLVLAEAALNSFKKVPEHELHGQQT